MRASNDNIVSKHYKEYDHTSEDYTVTAIDTEVDYNKRLRLEEAWKILLDSMHPKGLNSRMWWECKPKIFETPKNCKAELELHKTGNKKKLATAMVFTTPWSELLLRNNTDHRQQDLDKVNKRKVVIIPNIMERLSILKYNKQSEFNLYYTEKPPEYLCENCGTILASKQALKCHMVTKHSEKVTTYQCSKCDTTCNR